VCAVYDSGHQTRCLRSFPLLATIDELISFSVEASDSNQSEKDDVRALTNAWSEALSTAETALPNKTPQFVAMSKVSVALAVLSIIIGGTLLCISLLSMADRWTPKLPLWVLYLISTSDALLFTASGVLSILARNNSPWWNILASGFVSQTEVSGDGLGIWMLFIGAFLKFVAVGLFGSIFIFIITFLCCFLCLTKTQKSSVRIRHNSYVYGYYRYV